MINRRRFLTGLGGLTLGLPMLRHFWSPAEARAAGATTAPKRIIMMTYEMGTHVPMWAPSNYGTDFTLREISAPMEPFRDRAAWVSRVPHSMLDLGGEFYTYGHPAKKECLLTGTLLQNAFNGPNHVDAVISASPDAATRAPNGPSVDHVIGQALRRPSHARPSVDLAVPGYDVLGTIPSYFHYESAANPVTMQAHPGQAFAALFSGLNPDGQIDETLLSLQRRRKSVLDAVRDSFTDLRSRVDAEDRRVLDDHAGKIRQIELDMAPLAACTIPTGIATGDDPYYGMGLDERGELMNRIMAHAMGCNLAPVGRIEYLDQHDPYFGIPEIDDPLAPDPEFGWHAVVHAADEGWTLDHPVRVAGFRFYVQKFADLCAYLDEMVEGPDGSTVLDNSLLVLASDYGEGDGHSSTDLCFLIAGGTGPGRRGVHVDGSAYNVNQVLVSLMQMACVSNPDGSSPNSFGIEGFSTGGIPGLLS